MPPSPSGLHEAGLSSPRTPRVVVGIPVKSFIHAKLRLADALGDVDRHRLARALAERTLAAVGDSALALALVVATDEQVAAWAVQHGAETVLDPGTGLDAAAEHVARWATRVGTGWIVCHADLPLITAADLAPAIRAVADGRDVIAPSKDGGTSLLGSTRVPFPFSYGPESYAVHRSLLYDPLVLTSPGLTFDVDAPSDLIAASRLPAGAWLRGVVPIGSKSR